MKKLLSLIAVLTLTLATFTACSKDDDEPSFSYTSGQQKAMDTFHGTFVNTLDLLGWETTITFLEQYYPPLTIVRDGETREYIHGRYKETLYNGDSYDYYYHVGADGTTISYSMSKTWNEGTIHVMDLNVINTNEFRIKEMNSLIWESFIKK